MAKVMASINLYNNMSTVLQGVVSSMNLVISTARRVEGATGEMFDGVSVDAAQSEINKLSDNLAKIKEDIENNARENNNFNNSLREGTDIASKLRSYIMKIGGAYLSFQGVKSLVGLSDELTGINARLNLIKDSENDVASLQEKIFQSAQRSRGEYQVTADIVSKLGMQAKNAFKGNDELIAFSEQLNKNFAISGTEAEGIRSVMYNLTQAMATGVLRGQDLNSVMSNAPVILEHVADYLGTDISQIRKLAEEGSLTADVIKNALLASAEETNKKFLDMPLTFAQIATGIKNTFIKNIEPVAVRLNKLFNSEAFSKAADGIIRGIVSVANVLSSTLDIIIPMFSFMAENWERLKYVIFGLVGVIALYRAEMFLTDTAHKVVAGSAGILSVAYGLLHGQTLAATLAQQGFNVALLSSPIFWIPALILGIIALIYGVVAAINKVKGTTISATGVIVGSIYTARAFVGNLLIGLYNGIVDRIGGMSNIFISFAEFTANVFKNPVAAIKALFADVIKFIIDGFKLATNIIDTVTGSNLTESLNSMQSRIDAWRDRQLDEHYIKFKRFDTEGLKIDRLSYQNAYTRGYDWGKNLADKAKDKFKFDSYKNLNDYSIPSFDPSALVGGLDDINKNTKGIKDRLDGGIRFENEDLTYLREIATQRALNQISLDKISIDVHNSFGDVHENVDLDGWENGLVEGLKEAVNQSVSGVGEVL